MSIFDRFALKETGEQIQKLFHPPTPIIKKRLSPLDESAEEAKAQYPDDSKIVDDFLWALKDARRTRSKKAMEGYLEPMKAEARFFLSPDRLTAYACLLPPENDGDGITLEEFLGDMHYEGIIYGVLQDTIPQDFAQGYFHIFPVARGTPFREGEDGKVIELFKRRTNMRLEVQNGSEVDFSEDVQLQPIKKGTVICLIRAPKAGLNGTDVTGQEIPSPEPVSAYIPQGENIALDKGGHRLTADVDGILYIENNQFCIHAQKIIEGDLDQFQGKLQVTGNLYIGGNVDGGVEIETTGDIVINGKVGQARITSLEGTVRIQKGIHGTKDKTFLTAAGQLQAPVVEWAEVETGASLITETVSNCVIYCGGTVYAMTGRGMIVNSRIYTKDSILCLRIGNVAGSRSYFSVGYPPHVPEEWDRVKADLAESQATIEKLWVPITEFRRKGRHITENEKILQKRLVEQWELYMKRVEGLKAELRTLNKEMVKKSKAIIRCKKLYPSLDVRIGRYSEEIITVEENCNIHLDETVIRLE